MQDLRRPALRLRAAFLVFLALVAAPSLASVRAIELARVCVSADLDAADAGGANGGGFHLDPTPGPCANEWNVYLAGRGAAGEAGGLLRYSRSVTLAIDPEPYFSPARNAFADSAFLDLTLRWRLRYGSGCGEAALEVFAETPAGAASVPADGALAASYCDLLLKVADLDAAGTLAADVADVAGRTALAAAAVPGSSSVELRATADALAALAEALRVPTRPAPSAEVDAAPSAAPVSSSSEDRGGLDASLDAWSLAPTVEAESSHRGPVVAAAARVSTEASATAEPGSGAATVPGAPRGTRSRLADPSPGGATGPAAASTPVPPLPALAPREPPPTSPPGSVLAVEATATPPRLPSPPASAATAAGAFGLAVLLAALYHRIARPRLLEHRARAALLEAAKARGPATVGELAQACGLDRKTAEYHLVFLVRGGFLGERVAPDEPRRFVAPGSADRPSTARPLRDLVLERVATRPGLTTADLARDLGLTPSRAERRVKDLLLDGLLVSQVESGTRRLFPAEA